MTRAARRRDGMRDRDGRLRRVGVGADRVEPDGVRFRAVPELIGYLQDYLRISQADLADRCGLRRETVSRWSSGTVTPTLATLRAALAPLGWLPAIALEPTEAVLNEQLGRPVDLDELLGRQVLDLLATVCAAAAEGLDVVVGRPNGDPGGASRAPEVQRCCGAGGQPGRAARHGLARPRRSRPGRAGGGG
jgi:transcriptional regulator with XRE-family HTH domain